MIYLNQHLRSYHPTDEQVSQVDCVCLECSNMFQTAIELNTHLVSCLAEETMKNFKCPNCELDNWHSDVALRRHLAEVHRNILDVCDICGLVLKGCTYLSKHRRTHTDVKDFTCEQCGSAYRTREGLRCHIRGEHRKGKPDVCNICNAVFYYPYRLKRHMKTVHIREVKFQCEQCKYLTYQKHFLAHHDNIVHKKIVRYKCEHCDKAFYWKKDQVKHMSTQHGQLAVKCCPTKVLRF
jgi:KRAB domain-containing zinc finger protein